MEQLGKPFTFSFLFLSILSYAQVSGDFEGVIKSSSVEGVGDRNVVADQDGILKTGYSVNALPINPSVGEMVYFDGTSWQTITGGVQGQTSSGHL